MIHTLFSREELERITALPEVLNAHERLVSEPSVSFTIPASDLVKQRLSEQFHIDLSSLSTLPCRWIKGDTPAHVDKGQRSFENTYLVYLTDGEGEFRVGEESYPIVAGAGYTFPEGLRHEVTGTNGTARLLLGPMSEAGFAVGAPGTSLSFPGGTIVYIRQGALDIEYSDDQITWNTIDSTGPITVTNTDTSLGFLKVYFTTDITLNSNNNVFVLNSEYIQIGNESLDTDGSRPIITVTVANYDGLIRNGASGSNGYNNIRVYNLVIDGTGGSLQAGAGWFGQQYFGKGTTNNFILNCSSSGDINAIGLDGGGGILGDYAENVTLVGCSSSGTIAGNLAGGIVGAQVNSVVLQSCWSTGTMSGDGTGGIVGANSPNATIQNCYSEGDMTGNNTGGIMGANAGGDDSVTISNCYSRGNMTGANTGGICGSIGPDSGISTVSITNCYSAGNVANSIGSLNGGICGALLPSSSGLTSGAIIITISNCYTSGSFNYPSGYMIGNNDVITGTNVPSPPPSYQYILTNNFSDSSGNSGWTSANANTALTGTPSPTVGTTWVATVPNQPYELFNMGYTPYSTANISGTSLVRIASSTITAGTSSAAAILSGKSYTILQISGGDSDSYSTITMNSTTGAITTTTNTVPGTYTLSVRNTGSYNITTYTLVLTEAIINGVAVPDIACCQRAQNFQGADYTAIDSILAGNVILANFNAGANKQPLSYADIIRIRMAQAARTR